MNRRQDAFRAKINGVEAMPSFRLLAYPANTRWQGEFSALEEQDSWKSVE